jgi:DnaJ-class molecular chaperone
VSGETFYDPEHADHYQGEWTCQACGALNSGMDSQCQFCDGEAGPPEDAGACEECNGRGTVVYDDVAEGPIPCRSCNGRGF